MNGKDHFRVAPRNLRRLERCDVASLAGSSSGREEQRREILIASNVHSVNGAENGGIRYVSALVHRLAAELWKYTIH